MLLLALVPSLAAAQASGATGASGEREVVPAPATRKFVHSGYEEATITAALAALGLQEARAPEGRIIEGVDTVRLEMIEERDPAPRILNVIHVVTRPYVVERELLLRPGDRFQETLADETQRNLASLSQFSLVLVIPAEGRTPGTVRLVVITKDVWSLRLNWDATVTTHGLESLYMNPSETNLLGTHQTAGLAFRWLPASHSFGAQYTIPRVSGSHTSIAADAGIVLNNATGAGEGSYGDLSVTSPLWSSRTEWSWGASGSWSKEITRLYSAGEVALVALDPATRCAETPSLCLPWVYHSSSASAVAFATRSFGWAVKQDVTLGFSASTSTYTLPDVSAYDPATVAAFRATRLPRGEDRVGPYVQYRVYRSDFLRVLDLDTLALQEDYRLGPQAVVRFYPVLAALGSSRTLYGVTAGVSWLAAIGDGYAQGIVDTVTEVDAASGKVTDGSVRLEGRLATPRTALGRLVLDGALLDRYANSLNRLTSLGGDSRLRGYPTQAFVGQHFVVVNAEARSPGLQLLETVQLGGVVFYDAGNAFDTWSGLRLWHAVGVGGRVLFPQLDRVVFRVDVGVPLSRPLPAGATPVTLFATFGQAF